MIEDHFSINVARRVKPQTEPYGPYHEHLFRVTVPATRSKAEALNTFDDICGKYPEPQYKVTMSRITCRSTVVRDSGGT